VVDEIPDTYTDIDIIMHDAGGPNIVFQRGRYDEATLL
jgi:hypothetical protein